MVAVNVKIEEFVQHYEDVEFLRNSTEFRDNYDETDRTYVLADPQRTREMVSYIARYRLRERLEQTANRQFIKPFGSDFNWKEEGF